MGFEEKEISLIESRPVELFLFVQGETYTAQNSGTEEIFWSGKTWLPKLIKRSSKKISTNSLKSKMTIITSFANEFVRPYIFAAPDAMVHFTLYRGQYDEYIPYWRGFVEEVNFKEDTVEIYCTPMTSRLKRSGLMRKFSRMCGLPVYSTRCGLSTGAYQVVGVIDSTSGLNISSTTFGTKADQYFRGGWIEVNSYSRLIVDHQGNDVILNSPVPSLAVGMTFLGQMGCPHTKSFCNSVGNGLNYGGHAWLPHKNPFTGDAIGS
jgi:hypothetical protein